MVTAIAPTRLSLLGGGTDVGEYQVKYGGLVLSLAINIRQHIELQSKEFDLGPEWSADFRKIVCPPKAKESFYQAFLDEFGAKVCIKASFDGEITGGIGSSASAAVALIGAISKYKNLNMTKDQIAERAWDIEVNNLCLFGGKQDQYAAVYGGLNAMEFKDKVTVTPLTMGLIEPLLPYLMLFHTPNRKKPHLQEGLKNVTWKQEQALTFIKGSVVKGIEFLQEKNIEKFGELLKHTWEAKKVSNEVTTSEIDSLMRKAGRLGSLGGKLMGSGGGGYMFFIVPPDKQYDFKQKFCTKDVTWVDFSPDWNGLETRII